MDITSIDYPIVTSDKLRYSDTDRQGHINNALFSTFLETGRVELIYNPTIVIKPHDAEFVIANLTIKYIHEILWPGTVEIGTVVKKIGNSSLIFEQGIFQNKQLCASAETVIVQVNVETRKAMPLNSETIEGLKRYLKSE
ncbi:acyl-CoA thioesterase [Acinetobacter calcoaceticus]|uniref:acyl-CoA thioesterase n=1 Tax=Acinetobacter calcoaceticus TaxID=471 RepID=UPI002276E5D2|nr:thioesterase family protein [Acinetobacter calcoaceticus]GLG83353.1 hypothetical protein ACSO1_18750 [Acinetobacter calcoaceticus]